MICAECIRAGLWRAKLLAQAQHTRDAQVRANRLASARRASTRCLQHADPPPADPQDMWSELG